MDTHLLTSSITTFFSSGNQFPLFNVNLNSPLSKMYISYLVPTLLTRGLEREGDTISCGGVCANTQDVVVFRISEREALLDRLITHILAKMI